MIEPLSKRISKKQLAEERHRYDRYRAAFSTEDGLWVLADMMKSADRPSYEPGRTFDQVAFNEGSKAVLRRIRDLLDDNKLSALKKLELEMMRYE